VNTTVKPTFALKYKARWQETGEGWQRLVQRDYRDTLAKDPLPEGLVEGLTLKFGLACIYAGDAEHATGFCRHAIDLADYMIDENTCQQSPICEEGYPHNLAVVLRSKVYGQWLLGEALDRKEMRRVAERMTEWCLTKAVDRRRFNDSATMNVYLEGVRAAMIASDLDYASELLKIKHKFRWHHAGERDLWTRFIAAYPDVPQELRTEFETFFDRVRDPDFKEETWSDAAYRFVPTFINREILALETGIIRQMYLVNASAFDPVDPQAVIDAVAY